MRHAEKVQQNTETSTQPSAPSRILIHASSGDAEAGHHPLWKGDKNREIATCAISEGDGVKEMAEINARFERVLDNAPSDSTANLLLRRTKDGYKAFFRIRSTQSRFTGFISGRRLGDVVERVMNDVRLQIDAWRATRRLADEII